MEVWKGLCIMHPSPQGQRDLRFLDPWQVSSLI